MATVSFLMQDDFRVQKNTGYCRCPFDLVGVAGLEPTASWSRTKHATKLRYTPR